MKKVIFFVLLLTSFLLISCEEEEAIGIGCITYEDCTFGQLCIDGYCQDIADSGDTTGDTGNSADSVDTGNSANSADTANTGDSVDDSDTANTGNSVDDSDTANTGNSVDDGDTGNTGNSVDDGDTANTGNSVDDSDTADSADDGDSADTGDSATCGNSIVETDETCELSDTVECTTFTDAGFESGTATCQSDCEAWNKTTCECPKNYIMDGDGKCVENNECTLETHNCDANATCTDTPDSFTCACNDYYDGDGTNSNCTFCDTDVLCKTDCTPCDGETPKCKDNGDNTSQCVECLTSEDCTDKVCNSSNQCVDEYCGDGIIRHTDQPLDTNILVLLQMDENTGATTTDASGNNRTTSLSATAWTTSGKYKNALTFNGTTSYAVISGGYSPPTNTFTMEAWVKVIGTHKIDSESTSGTSGTTGQHELFGANHGSANAGAGISIGTNGISVYEHGDGYMPALAVYNGYIGEGWNHIAVTYTNKQPRIYLNGTLVRTGLTSPRASVFAPTTIGRGSYGYFNGTVDEVRIHSTALSAAQIQNHFYCDDGNNTNGDGCSSTCSVESNNTCTGEPSNCSVKSCTYTLKGYDSYGDGWDNGGSGFNEVDVSVNGTKIKDGFYVDGGYGPTDYTFTVTTGNSILLDYKDFIGDCSEETYELWQGGLKIGGRGKNYGENLTNDSLDMNHIAFCY